MKRFYVTYEMVTGDLTITYTYNILAATPEEALEQVTARFLEVHLREFPDALTRPVVNITIEADDYCNRRYVGTLGDARANVHWMAAQVLRTRDFYRQLQCDERFSSRVNSTR